jgi:hypothetical protein
MASPRGRSISTSGSNASRSVWIAFSPSEAELILIRIWSPRRGRTVRIELPPIRAADGVSEAMVAVVDAMAAGDITPDEAATITGILEVRRKAIETQEFAERLNRLEQQTGSR